MNARCSVTTGFFVLDRCPNPAAHQCPRCGRLICTQHTHFPPGGQFAGPCPECYGSDLRHLGDPRVDPSWTETFRRLFYWSAAGATGSQLWWQLFSDADRRNFRRGRRRRGWGDGDDEIDVDDDADFDVDFLDS